MSQTCLCFRCPAKCCRYMALQLDAPETAEDLQRVRWYLCHEGVMVFIDEKKWFVHLTSKCRHLRPDNKCGVYHTRPRICREYSNTDCDFTGADYEWEAAFRTPGEFEDYARRRLGRTLPPLHRTTSKAAAAALAAAERGSSTATGIKVPPAPPQPAALRLIGNPPPPPQPDPADPDATGRPWREIPVFIDTPESLSDMEDIRWYVMHEGVRIRVDADDRWTMLYGTRLLPGLHPDWEEPARTGPAPGLAWPKVFDRADALMDYARGQFGRGARRSSAASAAGDAGPVHGEPAAGAAG